MKALRLLTAALAALLLARCGRPELAFAQDTTTANYGFTKIQIGASGDTWGTKLNANADAIDAAIKSVATASLPLTGGAMTGPPAVVGAGNNIRLSFNQNGNDAYIYQGSGNGLNLGVGLYQNPSGTTIATIASGGALNIGATGFAVNAFSGATVGSPVTVPQIFKALTTSLTYYNAAGTLQLLNVDQNGNAGLYGSLTLNGDVDTTSISGPNFGVRIRNGSATARLQFTDSAASVERGAVNVDNSGAMTISAQTSIALASRPTFAGATPWDSYNLNPGAYQPLLGYTPVHQGGGAGQGSNAVYLGWSGSRLKAQVDGVDLGNVAFDSQLAGYQPALGYTAANAAGQAFAGAISATGITAAATSAGSAQLASGGSSAPGYAAFYTADSTRRGFIGYNDGSSHLQIESENGWNWNFSQTPLIAGNPAVSIAAGASGAGTISYGTAAVSGTLAVGAIYLQTN